MSEPRRLGMGRVVAGGLALVATIALPRAIRAQDAEYYRGEVARLTRMRDEARIAAARADSLALAALPQIVVRESGFVIRTERGLEAIARKAAASAAPGLRRMFGDLYTEMAAEPMLLRYQPEREGRAARERETGVGSFVARHRVAVPVERVVQLTTLLPDGRPALPWMNEAPDADRLARRLTSRVGDLYFARLPADVHAWLGVGLAVNDTVGGRMTTYTDLVTTASKSTHACFARDVSACRIALALDPIGDPLDTWYAPDERPALVVRARFQLLNGMTRVSYRQCVEQHVIEMCDRLLRMGLNEAVGRGSQRVVTGVTTQGALVPPPLGNVPRHTITQLAMSLGGPGAARRLLDAPAGSSIAERLTFVSGLGADSLVSLWHARILAARPGPVTLTPRIAWAALAWGLFASAFALRSTRWR
jgi:hypothetical protein